MASDAERPEQPTTPQPKLSRLSIPRCQCSATQQTAPKFVMSETGCLFAHMQLTKRGRAVICRACRVMLQVESKAASSPGSSPPPMRPSGGGYVGRQAEGAGEDSQSGDALCKIPIDDRLRRVLFPMPEAAHRTCYRPRVGSPPVSLEMWLITTQSGGLQGNLPVTSIAAEHNNSSSTLPIWYPGVACDYAVTLDNWHRFADRTPRATSVHETASWWHAMSLSCSASSGADWHGGQSRVFCGQQHQPRPAAELQQNCSQFVPAETDCLPLTSPKNWEALGGESGKVALHPAAPAVAGLRSREQCRRRRQGMRGLAFRACTCLATRDNAALQGNLSVERAVEPPTHASAV